MQSLNISKSVKVAPSIIAGNIGSLADEAKRLEDGGADMIHIDIMDGNFVPNLTLGPQAVAAIRKSTKLFLDVHLMIYHPYDYVIPFVEAGADNITIHFEATEDVRDTLQFIRKCGINAGLAFSPETSTSFLGDYLFQCNLLLLMAVNPGFCGQQFVADTLNKISLTRELCNKLNIFADDSEKSPFPIQVDGGINDTTGLSCVKAGANILVSGSFIFNHRDIADGINKLRFI